MNESSPQTIFLAVLIYDNGNGWRSEEPYVYHASHPEIAYQRALADGEEHRYGRQFLGLSRLEEIAREIERIARSQKGDAKELVVRKEDLAAFCDPRWSGVPCDPTELANALRDPPLLVEVEGLEQIRWHQYPHAYGPATDVPRNIRRLASSQTKVREQALWELSGSIYHQGTLYGATAVAIPCILRLAADTRVPDRPKMCRFLAAVAESAAVDATRIRDAWALRGKKLGEVFGKPTAEMAEEEIANVRAVRGAFLDHLHLLQKLQSDADSEVARIGMSIAQGLSTAGK
jgi:hypothetical protein